jgi:polysaccharide biosynthesis protein
MMAFIDTLKSKFNNNKKVAENYFFMTFLASSALVIGLIIYPYAVRVLGKEAYGIYVFVFSNVQLFQLITTFGFDTPALKKIALFPDNREVKSRVVSEVLISKSLLFCLSLVVLSVVSRFIPFLQKHILLYYILFSLQLVEILFPTWYFQGIQKMKFVTYTNLIIRLSTIPLIFIFVRSPNDLLLYVVIVSLLPLVGGIFAFCYLLVKEKIKLRFISLRRLKSTFRNALPFFWTTAFGTVKKESLTFIVGAFFDMQSVAVLDLANKLVVIPRIITTSINGALFPAVVGNCTTERIRRIIRYETYIALIIIALIAAFGYWAVLILGGKNMVEAYPLAVIQSITIYTWLIVGCYINFVFIPKNRYNLVANNQFVAMVSFLLLAVCSLLFYKNVIIIVSAFAISHIAEIIYCRYAVRRYKLFD